MSSYPSPTLGFGCTPPRARPVRSIPLLPHGSRQIPSQVADPLAFPFFYFTAHHKSITDRSRNVPSRCGYVATLACTEIFYGAVSRPLPPSVTYSRTSLGSIMVLPTAAARNAKPAACAQTRRYERALSPHRPARNGSSNLVTEHDQCRSTSPNALGPGFNGAHFTTVGGAESCHIDPYDADPTITDGTDVPQVNLWRYGRGADGAASR